MSSSTSALFSPIRVGNLDLQHRIVLAPLTRMRAHANHVPTPQAPAYYSQRGSTPGTLLISEATFISQNAGGYDNIPGIYTDAHVEGWKKVTDAVHEKGSFIFLQLWALGRAAETAVLAKENNSPYVGASPILLPGRPETEVPRALTTDEIKEYVATYAAAAKTAIRAGFDGVEIHGANGYLIDQFIQDVFKFRQSLGQVAVDVRFDWSLRQRCFPRYSTSNPDSISTTGSCAGCCCGRVIKGFARLASAVLAVPDCRG